MLKYILILVVIIGAIAGFTMLRQNKLAPSTNPVSQNEAVPQKVTSDNVDSTLNQTDQTINQTASQMDQDLKDLDTIDKTNGSESDVNNL